jgi:hypothetical protein
MRAELVAYVSRGSVLQLTSCKNLTPEIKWIKHFYAVQEERDFCFVYLGNSLLQYITSYY